MKSFRWCTGITYDIKSQNKITFYNKNTNCFSYLKSNINENTTSIIIHNINCKETYQYRNFYLKYLTSMLNLKNVKIEENSFEFDVLNCKNKNLLVATLVRFLFEPLGNELYRQLNIDFLNNLQNGKSKYKDKLKRFCDFYLRLNDDSIKYWGGGHNWHPKDTKIKSTKDFQSLKQLDNVNDFFRIG